MKRDDFAISTTGLTRYFGSRPAVCQVDLNVPRGCVFGFLGRNGSGKTTTIRMLLGLLAPTRGTCALFGCNSRSLAPEIRARVGYLSEDHRVLNRCTVAENAKFQSATFPRWNQRLFDTIAAQFQLHSNMRASELSRGERAGLALALTLAPEPDLLILDDPALGLDPVARRGLIESVLSITRSKERTIFLSSHIVEDIERMADEIAILDQGALRAHCSLDEFRERVRRYNVSFPTGTDGKQRISELSGLVSAECVSESWRLTLVGSEADIRTKLEALAPVSIESMAIPLEEAVVSYLGNRGCAQPFIQQLERQI